MFASLEQLGRRWTVIISDAIFTVGAILCTVATHQLGLMYAGRLLTGLGVGGIAAVCPIYIAEISPPAIRGRLTGFFESSYQIGAVIGFWINYGIVHNIEPTNSIAWRIPMAVQLIPAGLLALGIPFLRESPTWLLKHGHEEKAYNVLGYYRNLPVDHVYVEQDVAHIQNQIEGERALTGGVVPTFGSFVKTALRESCMKGMRNRFLLVFIMFMWQGWSGAAAINYYSPTIFTSIGLSDVTLWTGIYGIIKAAGSIVFFTFFIDTFGRKMPWIISSLTCAACQYYLAGYIAVGNPQAGEVQSASTVAGGKAATAAIMVFGAAWSFGANGLPWIISAEIFPSSLRSISGPWAGMSVWLWTFVVTKALPSMFSGKCQIIAYLTRDLTDWGTGMGFGVYIFFASMLILASIYAWFFIHETKGVRMDQMDELFGFARPDAGNASKLAEEGEFDDDADKPKDAQVTRVEVA